MAHRSFQPGLRLGIRTLPKAAHRICLTRILNSAYVLFRAACKVARTKSSFEVFAYSNVKMKILSPQGSNRIDHWRDIRALNDDAAADLIEADAIDILVDLSAHTGFNRLLARKPAPVQVTWLGFPATTGMKAMDYRITDSYAEPPGMTDHLNTEMLWRLPQIFCCFRGPGRDVPVIDHPPFEDNGFITFGCDNFSKVTDKVLEAWAEILNRVRIHFSCWRSRALVFSYMQIRKGALRSWDCR